MNINRFEFFEAGARLHLDHYVFAAGRFVLYTDYASLLERCEKMEKALETINRWGNDKEPEYALHVVDIVRISAEALAAKEEGNV